MSGLRVNPPGFISSGIIWRLQFRLDTELHQSFPMFLRKRNDALEVQLFTDGMCLRNFAKDRYRMDSHALPKLAD